MVGRLRLTRSSLTWVKPVCMPIWARRIRLIVVEIKTFIGDSFINELHRATGQYMNYRSLIRQTSEQYEVFLAVPLQIYKKYFGQHYVQVILKDLQIKLVIFDSEQEVITEWIQQQN